MLAAIRFVTTVLLLLPVVAVQAQTEISGGIYSDAVWTREKSPYWITGNTVLFPDKTLRVEPGVHIRFKGNYNLEIRGRIIMEGREGDTILLNSDFNPQHAYDSTGIVLDYYQVEFSFSYCKFDSLACAVNGKQHKQVHHETRISHCSFTHCDEAFSDGMLHYPIPVDSCFFSDNQTAVGSDSVNITYSTFINNWFATGGGGVNISYSEFYGNGTAAGLRGGSRIEYSTLMDNDLAISCDGMYVSLEENIISDNEIGIVLEHLSSSTIKNNRICNNSQYNVKNMVKDNLSIGSNCWCTSDSAVIEEKIFDGYDDITKGLLNYDIYDPGCENKIKSIVKVNLGPDNSSPVRAERSKIEIIPNPARERAILRLPHFGGPATIRIYSMEGRLVFEKEILQAEFTFDLTWLGKGTYLVRCLNSEGIGSSILVKL